MADPAAMQELTLLLDEALTAEIFVRLPPKEFHRCRCLSRRWAAVLSSDAMIDKHLSVRGQIQLDYATIMQGLVLKCSRVGEYSTKEEGGGGGGGGGGEEEEECDWREEYRTKGYVAADKDYYVRREEMRAWMNEEWAKIDFSGLTFAGPDDELLKACTVPLGALHARIRGPVIEAEGLIEVDPVRGREKTDEDVDNEIVAFLVELRNMDPQPQFLKEFDTYVWPWPAHQAQEPDSEEELDNGQGDNLLEHSDIGDFDEQDSSNDSDHEEEHIEQPDNLDYADGEVDVEACSCSADS